MDRAALRAAAAEAGLRPNPGLWQHFLHATETVEQIVDLAGIRHDDHVLQVGAGLGSITLALLARRVSVCAVDIDAVLAHQLPYTIATHAPHTLSQLAVLHADATTLQRSDRTGEPTVLMASLPAYAAVPALLHLMDQFPSLRSVILQTDAPTTEQIAAEPQSPYRAAATVKADFFGTSRRCAPTSPTAFWPILRTHAELIRLDRHEW